jgi:hypothetical protein
MCKKKRFRGDFFLKKTDKSTVSGNESTFLGKGTTFLVQS